MSLDLIVNVLSDAFMTVLLILAPILGIGLVVGIAISIFQAATSIQEMTLTFVPKIIVTAVVIIITLPFMADKLINFTYQIFDLITVALK